MAQTEAPAATRGFRCSAFEASDGTYALVVGEGDAKTVPGQQREPQEPTPVPAVAHALVHPDPLLAAEPRITNPPGRLHRRANPATIRTCHKVQPANANPPLRVAALRSPHKVQPASANPPLRVAALRSQHTVAPSDALSTVYTWVGEDGNGNCESSSALKRHVIGWLACRSATTRGPPTAPASAPRPSASRLASSWSERLLAIAAGPRLTPTRPATPSATPCTTRDSLRMN